ncbi:RNA polymerase subunit sigma [Nocardioides glacieisoli]|uniref:RNA polymerase subunit sigma n=1 Tax=Nocardioides glacieisoli TaxID=1168730 RepID=A0A4Q2RJD9_9ACTN|nr:sigma factor [Nocardioides glacieisoli]RYB88448.1 RNA polymerase subunit sigma [Nocardioides glacieisoli]
MAGRSSTRADARRGLEELLLLSGRGDAEAFAGVYDELAPQVYGLAMRLLGDAAAAEAVTVEAFLEAWRRAPSYDPTTSSAAAWVLVLSHRLAVRTARGSGPAGRDAATGPRPDSPLLAAGLSPCQAHAVELAYFDGLDHLQVAALLDCAEPVPALVTDGLELLASADSRR